MSVEELRRFNEEMGKPLGAISWYHKTEQRGQCTQTGLQQIADGLNGDGIGVLFKNEHYSVIFNDRKNRRIMELQTFNVDEKCRWRELQSSTR